jgi:putative ABC transport system ATP-binding protein
MDTPRDLAGTDVLVRCHDVEMSYGDPAVSVLHSLEFVVTRGEFVAIMGRSGSGKSTLLNLIGGMDSASAGEINVAGINLGKLSERARTKFRRESVGFIFQTYNLVPTLTAAQNLQLPLELNSRHVGTKVTDMLCALELKGLGERYPHELSGGEQQRVAIGRALIHAPPLVIADEPTGNLDARTSTEVLALLKSLSQQSGATIVMATHSVDAARIADRTLQIRDGNLANIATP